MNGNDIEQLARRVLKGDHRALARMITLVENRSPTVAGVLGELYDHTGRAYVIGITGPPGSGKSTLADKLIAKYRAEDISVGVVAIDPSSPFSGGALLGDRVRMSRHATDQKVFIRSVGSRGSYGGISRATHEIVGLMDAFGFSVIIVETVGVGQTELDIMDLADTVIVVFVPESGDVVQTMKAGLTEIADIFVVNKSDRPGADAMMSELRQTIDFDENAPWRVPALKTVAFKNEGIDELAEKIAMHREYLRTARQDPETLGRVRINRFVEVVSGLISDHLSEYVNINGDLGDIARDVYEGRLNPYVAAQRILSDPKMIADLAIEQKDES